MPERINPPAHALPAAATLEPDHTTWCPSAPAAGRWVDTHGEMIAELADEDTRAALRQLELEEETRLERIWRAHRLELLLRDFPAWAFPQPR